MGSCLFSLCMGLSQIVGGLAVLALNHTDSEVPYSPSLTTPLLEKLSYCSLSWGRLRFCRWSLRRSLPQVSGFGRCCWSLSLVPGSRL